MSGKNTNFNDKKIRKSDFYKNKKIHNIQDIDVNNILVSEKEAYCNKNSHKYFIGYNDNDIIRLLCKRLVQMTGYVTKFDKNATMSFIVKDKLLLKSYSKLWEKIEVLMMINFETNSVYGDHDKYKKAKIKIYADSIITNFHNKKIPQEKAPYKSLSILMVDPVFRVNKKYSPQTLLEECKYIQEKTKTENYINDDSDDESDNDETESDIDMMINNLLKVF